MSRTINFEGRKISVPDDATDDEVASILGGQNAAPAEPVVSQSLGFKQGVGNFLANAAKPAIWAGEKLGADMSEFKQGQDVMRTGSPSSPNEVPGKIGRFGADLLETLPLAAVTPTRLLPAIASGTAAGALTGDPEHMGRDAVIGGGLGGGMNLAGRAIAPHVSEAVQMMSRNGVTMTPGQIFGGFTKGVEDRMAGFPIVGDFIKDAQRNSMRDFFNGGADGGVNSALAPLSRLGGPARPPGNDIIPLGHPGISTPEIPRFPNSVPDGHVGQDSVRFAGDTLSDAYDTVLPHTQTVLGPDFWEGVMARTNEASRQVLPAHADQLNNIVTGVFNKVGPLSDHTQIDGRTMKMLDTELGELSRRFSGTQDTANNGVIADVFARLRDDLRGRVMDSNPNLAPQLSAINEGWSKLVPLERAAAGATGNASGLEAGVASPRQYRQAIRQGDTSVRDRATARGGQPGQDYAEAGISTLPSSVPDSGTAGRLALPAAIAAAFANPALALKAAAVPAVYNRPVLSAVNSAFAHGAGPVQSSIGDMVRRLAVPAAGTIGMPQRRK